MGKITCEACNKKCKGQALKLPTNKYFHIKCFKCKECNKVLSNEAYFMRDSAYYCRPDYMRLFLIKCSQCCEYIEDELISVDNKSYHTHCFMCSHCKKCIEAGRKVIIRKGEKICEGCDASEVASESQANNYDDPTLQPAGESRTNYFNGGIIQTSDVDNVIRSKEDNDGGAGEIKEDLLQKNQKMNSVHINSPDSDYSMELKNLTDYSLEENMTLNCERSEVNLFSPMSLTSGYKSDVSYNQDQEKSQMNLTTDDYASYRCASPESTFSRKSKDSSTSEHSSSRKSSTTLTFGRFLQGSYLDRYLNDSNRYIKSPSCNPTIRENIPVHFHCVDGFSYRKPRTDIRKSPSRKHGGTKPINSTNRSSPKEIYKPEKKQEVIQMSKLPDGHETNNKPIERDDFPAPPHVAAVYPQLLREHHRRFSPRPVSRSDDNLKCHYMDKENIFVSNQNHIEDDGEEDKLILHRKSKLQRDIHELSKIDHSGAVQLILKDLQRKQQLPIDLDPRSASRTPSANREPPYKTRYHSPIYASPSRDLLMRSHLQHLDDDFELKYRTVVTPLPRPPGSRPKYHKSRSSYTSRDLMTSYRRPGSTDGCLEHRMTTPMNVVDMEDEERRQCSASVCDRFSQYSSHSDLDEFNPLTGLKTNKLSRVGLDGRLTPISLLSNQFYSIHRSIVTSISKDDANIKTYPYESLKVTSTNRPAHLDDENLEQYLTEESFEELLGMDKAEFYHLPAWKRNDMKKRINLFR